MFKINGALFGYVLGVVVVIPLLVIAFNFLFLAGNRDADKYVDQYIDNSKVIEVFLPKGEISSKSELYTDELGKKAHTSLNKFTFYSPIYEKHLVLLTFRGFDFAKFPNGKGSYDRNEGRTQIAYGGNIDITARVNNIQWDNPNYGTEDNPLPIFAITRIGKTYGENEDFTVSDKTNRIFVYQYLKRFMPKEEFKAMFENE